jgi:transposase
MTAKATQTARMSELGIHGGKGANVRSVAATRGHITPRTRIGHAAAAPTRADSHTFSPELVGPKSATTAHPKRAERMLPSDRVMRASSP